MENPPKEFFRLAPGREVRLRYAYFMKCNRLVKDKNGEITELHCTYDPQTRGGNTPPDGRKVKATIHWVSAPHAIDAEVRLYDRLFMVENPLAGKEEDFTRYLNPQSMEVLKSCKLEPCLAEATADKRYQFERLGYFCADLDSKPQQLIFNRAVSLRDQWTKVGKIVSGQ